MHASCVINLSNLVHNYNAVRRLLKPRTKMMGVVKADAYGHGAPRVAKTLQDAGIDCLGVAITEEAIQLRENGIEVPILVFGRIPDDEYGYAADNALDLTLFDKASAIRLNRYLKSAGKRLGVYIKLDTGMGRLGMTRSDRLTGDIREIYGLSNLDVRGIYSHFSVADSDPEYTRDQYGQLSEVLDELGRSGIPSGCSHICNSAAAIAYPWMQLGMVRIGLSMYGLYPSEAVKKTGNADLREVMSVRSGISQIKVIERPSYISYGNTYTAGRGEIICTIPVGYADGIPRALSNNFDVLIRGRRCRAVGTVCMDYIMVRCDEMPGYSDEAVLFGEQGGEHISVDEIAHRAGTISYEILTRVGGRLSREYIY